MRQWLVFHKDITLPAEIWALLGLCFWRYSYNWHKAFSFLEKHWLIFCYGSLQLRAKNLCIVDSEKHCSFKDKSWVRFRLWEAALQSQKAACSAPQAFVEQQNWPVCSLILRMIPPMGFSAHLAVPLARNQGCPKPHSWHHEAPIGAWWKLSHPVLFQYKAAAAPSTYVQDWMFLNSSAPQDIVFNTSISGGGSPAKVELMLLWAAGMTPATSEATWQPKSMRPAQRCSCSSWGSEQFAYPSS